MSIHPHDEREPLLHHEEPAVQQQHHQPHWLKSIGKVREVWSRPSTPVLVYTFLLQFLISLAKHIVEVPLIRLLELSACHEYYAPIDGVVGHVQALDNRPCKVPAVQNELSTLTGWKFGFDALPGLLLAIYYGSVAGKYGRKPVLLLFSTGMLLSLAWLVFVCWLDGKIPIRLIWLSSLFIFIGGGQRVAKAMLFTIVSDTVDASHRTRYMSFLSSIPHISTLISPPLSAIFMRISIWLPFEIAIGALVLTYVLILAMPESSKLELPPDDIDDNATNTPSDIEERSLLPTDPDFYPVHPPHKPSSWHTEIRNLLSIPTLRFSFIVFFITPIGLISKAFVYQHASESFAWRMSTTTWLRVSQAAGASLVTLLALPLLNTLLLRRPGVTHAQRLDLAVLRASLLIAAIGFAILWQAQSSWMLVLALFVCGLSEAIQPSNQGLATSLIGRGLNARLFTTVAVLETVGKLAGGPLQSVLFSLGRREGRGSAGVNFLASSGVFVGLLGLALVVRVKR